MYVWMSERAYNRLWLNGVLVERAAVKCGKLRPHIDTEHYPESNLTEFNLHILTAQIIVKNNLGVIS